MYYLAFQKTKESELEWLNHLILSSKRAWGYEESYLEEAAPLLKIDSNWLAQHDGYSILADGNILLGFLGIKRDLEGAYWIEHLWIAPDYFKQGVGKTALEFAKIEYQGRMGKGFLLFPEPEAEPFYLKCGANYLGEKVPSRIANGPKFSKMILP